MSVFDSIPARWGRGLPEKFIGWFFKKLCKSVRVLRGVGIRESGEFGGSLTHQV
jgi:hypothetical protein